MADYAKYEPILEMAQGRGLFARGGLCLHVGGLLRQRPQGQGRGPARGAPLRRRPARPARRPDGYAATEAEGEAAYAELVRAAAENAALLESQDEQFLYDGDEKLAWVSAVDESLLAVSPERKIALALEMERLCKAEDPRIRQRHHLRGGDDDLRVPAAQHRGPAPRVCPRRGLRRGGRGARRRGPAVRRGRLPLFRKFEDLDPVVIAREAVQMAAADVGSASMPSGRPCPSSSRPRPRARCSPPLRRCSPRRSASAGSRSLRARRGRRSPRPASRSGTIPPTAWALPAAV